MNFQIQRISEKSGGCRKIFAIKEKEQKLNRFLSSKILWFETKILGYGLINKCLLTFFIKKNAY